MPCTDTGAVTFTKSTNIQNKLLVVTEIVNIAVNDFDPNKYLRHSRVIVVTELIECSDVPEIFVTPLISHQSRNQCRLRGKHYTLGPVDNEQYDS